MNGLFYMICILSISLAPPVSGNICLGTPVVITMQCKNISTGDGYYKYPWSLPPGKVCKDLEVYADNQPILLAKHPNATLPKLTQCRNLTVRCIYEMNGTANVDEICREFVTAKQQLNNTSEQTDTDSVKNQTSNMDQSNQPAAVSVGVPLAVVLLLLVPLAALAVWLCRRKKKQTVRTEDGALPEQTAAQPEAQSLLSGTSRFRPGAFSADYSAATDDVTVTMPDAFGGKTRLNGDCKD
ncbi:uncharacterized protein LOC130371504 isoform X2 [Gadus chalcogrammus]|uniref:uncharacterized protein LOC130371504 isoform X2 n=1 Tax=Gadus chalcogrammus TaxID=1042646 RepID=UPI0024C3B240|nr:uncharacterized protein LOC130371504 isoform X2 [Gadus chalcogrammus]